MDYEDLVYYYIYINYGNIYYTTEQVGEDFHIYNEKGLLTIITTQEILLWFNQRLLEIEDKLNIS